MKNMCFIIFSYNKQVLQPQNENYVFNCRKKGNCQLDNKSLTPNIIYDAQITSKTNEEHKKYLGAAEISFKERYSNHTQDFKQKENEVYWTFKIYLEFEGSMCNTHR